MKKIPIGSDVQLCWALANAEACFSGNESIEPVHFSLALLNILDDAFQQDARKMGVPPEGIEVLLCFATESRKMLNIDDSTITAARRDLRKTLREGRSPRPMEMLHRAEASRSLFRSAGRRVIASGDEALTLEYILEEIVSDPPREVAAYFGDQSKKVSSKPRKTQGHSQEVGWQSIEEKSPAHHSRKKTPAVDDIGRDVTALARRSRLPKVVGRQQEMTALARFLSRTAKRGVMLIGKPGVGKTAVVEGFAQRIANNSVPEFLQSLRIVQLNVADLISGTKYRGDMEKRLQDIILEAEHDPDLILFLDEVHLVMQSVGGGAPEIANILKPALGRDDLRIIGATTDEEFERYVRPDGAFMRRFQILRIPEPAQHDCIVIAEEWIKRIEDHQAVIFQPGTANIAVSLAADLLPDRNLPDSAIDLLENAATFAKVSSLTLGNAVPQKTRPNVDVQLIHRVLQEVHGVSANTLEAFDTERIRSVLCEKVIGQGRAIDELVDSLDTSRLAKASRNAPVAVFLFAGSSGIGKTLTAECLSEAMFGEDNQRFLRINMSELKERHDIARLIGAPPGFIGHDQEPVLFQFIKGSPQGLILLDEMEKAHAEIQDYFLQIFDKGTARDSHGRSADFRHTVFVMTCNIGGEEHKKKHIGFMQGQSSLSLGAESNLKAALREYFRPEFIARIDRCISFDVPSDSDLEIVLSRQFQALADRVEIERGVEVVLGDVERRVIAQKLCVPNEGVRGFVRALERLLFTPLLKYLDSLPGEVSVIVGFSGDKPVFQKNGTTK